MNVSDVAKICHETNRVYCQHSQETTALFVCLTTTQPVMDSEPNYDDLTWAQSLKRIKEPNAEPNPHNNKGIETNSILTDHTVRNRIYLEPNAYDSLPEGYKGNPGIVRHDSTIRTIGNKEDANE